MGFRPALVALALLAGSLACRGPGVRPTKDRRPVAADLEKCARESRRSGTAKATGSFTLALLVDVDGTVPAAFVHDAAGIDSPELLRCSAELMLGAKLSAEGLDSLRSFGPVSFSDGGARVVDGQSAARKPLNEKVAQETLALAEWATPVDRGQALLHVHRYDDAIRQLRSALLASPDDARALGSLASALAGSDGDLDEARKAAARAIELKPASEAGHEALLRVCLAQHDDACVRDEAAKARAAPDAPIRAAELAELEPQLQAAQGRLEKADRDQRARATRKDEREHDERQKKLDPHGCKKLEGTERTLCYVRGCVEKGSRAYVDGLQELTGQAYKAGTFTAEGAKDGSVRVTLPIRAGSGLPHDASWDVQLDEGLTMKPLDIDANNISNQYDECRK